MPGGRLRIEKLVSLANQYDIALEMNAKYLSNNQENLEKLDYMLKNANKIDLLYFVRGTTRLDKYYYYNAKMDMFIPNDLITIGLMEFGGTHKDLENKQVLDYNMNLRHNNFKGSLGNWLTTGEALEFHDRESFKKIFMQSAEYNEEEE